LIARVFGGRPARKHAAREYRESSTLDTWIFEFPAEIDKGAPDWAKTPPIFAL
jgi:hypothetical protein